MKKLNWVFVISMVFIFTNASGQTVPGSKKTKPPVVTYLDPVIKLVGTNFYYGNSNSALKDYKRQILGAQAGITFHAGITSRFALVAELYLNMKGGKLKAGNPLTNSETVYRLYPIELPVLARFYMGRFYANAGPSIAYNFYGTPQDTGYYFGPGL
jgi:hypothetical protein